MIINREELVNALTLVKPGLSGAKETIKQTSSFAFMKGYVVTYNDEISIRHPLKDIDITGVIKAEELYQFLSKVTKDEISIEVTKNELALSAGRIRSGFVLESEVMLPLEEVTGKSKWKPLPEDFSHFLSLTMGACGNDMTKALLTCVNVEQSGKMTGSDNYRMMHCDLGEEIPVSTFLLPASSAVEVVKLNPTEIAKGKGWIHFRSKEGTEISCRLFEDDYGDKSKILNIEGIELNFPRTIHSIVERALIFAKRDYILDEVIRLELAENRIKVKAKSEIGSWFEEEANMRYDDDPVFIAITPYLLKDMLEASQSCILSEHLLKFEGAGWQYITALRND